MFMFKIRPTSLFCQMILALSSLFLIFKLLLKTNAYFRQAHASLQTTYLVADD